MTDEQVNEIVQISEAIRNCYLNAIERTDADRDYRQGQRNIAKWLEELKRYKEMQYVRSQPEPSEEITLDNCSLIRNAGGKPKQYDGKCEGYSNKFDDEPHEQCKECKLNVFYEE